MAKKATNKKATNKKVASKQKATKANSKNAKTASIPAYPPHTILSTGLAGKCPRCAQGALFQSFMKPVKSCGACGLDMSFAEEGDGPAVFAIFILGFVIVGLALYVEFTFRPPVWVHILLWLPITTAMSTFALKVIKGVMIAAQYKTDAREGTWDGVEKR